MAAITGKTFFHPDGSEEDVPVVQLKAAEINSDNVTIDKPTLPRLEPPRVELDMPDYELEWLSEAEEETLSLYQLPAEVSTLKATVKRQQAQIERLMKQNKHQGQALGRLSFLEETLKRIDLSKLPQNPNHPDVKMAKAERNRRALAELRADLEADRNSYDSIWKNHR